MASVVVWICHRESNFMGFVIFANGNLVLRGS